MKTVEHKGNVYQIGAVYEFSDNKEDWELDTLTGVDLESTNYIYEGTRDKCRYIRECQAPIGTITEAPVDLVDGECYQFDYYAGDTFRGVYDKEGGYFWVKAQLVLAKYCSNIKPLTVD